MSLSPFVRVQTQVEGLHHWPGAQPPDEYLAAAHRHLFVVDLKLGVDHDDRDVEINALTRWLTDLLPALAARPSHGPGAADPAPVPEPLDFGAQSCEQLATRIITAVNDRYGTGHPIECTVWEDGILGGGAHWQPDPPPAP